MVIVTFWFDQSWTSHSTRSEHVRVLKPFVGWAFGHVALSFQSVESSEQRYRKRMCCTSKYSNKTYSSSYPTQRTTKNGCFSRFTSTIWTMLSARYNSSPFSWLTGPGRQNGFSTWRGISANSSLVKNLPPANRCHKIARHWYQFLQKYIRARVHTLLIPSNDIVWKLRNYVVIEIVKLWFVQPTYYKAFGNKNLLIFEKKKIFVKYAEHVLLHE